MSQALCLKRQIECFNKEAEQWTVGPYDFSCRAKNLKRD